MKSLSEVRECNNFPDAHTSPERLYCTTAINSIMLLPSSPVSHSKCQEFIDVEGEISFDEDLMMSLRKLKEERTQVRIK